MGMLIAFNMFGQTATDVRLSYKGGKFFMNGKVLEKAELADALGYQYVDALKVQSKRSKGLWELGAGTAAVVAGVAWTAFGVSEMDKALDGIEDDGNNMTGMIVGPAFNF